MVRDHRETLANVYLIQRSLSCRDGHVVRSGEKRWVRPCEKHVLSVLAEKAISLRGDSCSRWETLIEDFLVESNRVSRTCLVAEKLFSLVLQEEESEAYDMAKPLFSQAATLLALQEILNNVAPWATEISGAHLSEANTPSPVILGVLCSCPHLFLCMLGSLSDDGLLLEHMSLYVMVACGLFVVGSDSYGSLSVKVRCGLKGDRTLHQRGGRRHHI